MNAWRRLVVLTLWILSLIAVSHWGPARAQSTQQRSAQSQPQQQFPAATVITGADLGFMVFPGTLEQGKPAGVIVIRQQGRWVPAELGKQMFPGSSSGQVIPLH
jgi:hypothetical protein